MIQLNPYLTFLGNCEEAFTFYKSIFGRDFTYIGRFGDMPPQEGITITEEDKHKIMHVSLPIDNNAILMGSDTLGERQYKTTIGNNFSLSLNVDTKADADRLFKSLAEGGNITMPMANTFWGDYFGMCTDKFSINWMISFNKKEQ